MLPSRVRMPHHESAAHSPLLDQHLAELTLAAALGPIVDLACGTGRNGLFLASQGLPVVFADRSAEALSEVRQQLSARGLVAETWHVDLETGDDPLAGKQFGAALVFRYLHRPLMPRLAASIAPGGLVIYETFTVHNLRYGRPNNPEFLLLGGELPAYFPGFTTLHAFEGFLPGPDREVAQLVARKPLR